MEVRHGQVAVVGIDLDLVPVGPAALVVDVLQMRAVPEGRVLDLRHGFGDVDGLHRGATVEGGHLDDLDAAGNDADLQRGAVVKGGLAEGVEILGHMDCLEL